MATVMLSPLPPKPPPPPSERSSWSSLSLLAFALLIVYHFHLDWTPSLPRIQAIAYPAGEGEDITYGLRLSLGGRGGDKERSAWQIELGKIVDDGLRQRVLNQEVGVGVSDSWWYFKVVSGEDSHLLLASLWQANLITRREAEAVLGKGPLHPSSPHARAPSIHRIPSLATLTAAYYAGAHVGTRVILGKLNVAESRGAQVLIGAGAVGGAVVVGSRSSRGTSSQGNTTEEVELESTAGGGIGAMGLLGARGGGALKITVLSGDECRTCPCFGASPPSSFVASNAEIASPGPTEDWLLLTAASMWDEERRRKE